MGQAFGMTLGCGSNLAENVNFVDQNQFLKNTADNVTPVEQPFTRVGLDTIDPLPITKNGNMYIITMVDYFTKWVEAKAISSTKN